MGRLNHSVFLTAALLTACDVASDQPRLLDASAVCDEADGSWRLEAVSDHDGGPARIVTMHFDIALLLIDGDFTDTQYLGSHSLEHDGEGLWFLDLPLGTTQLECGGVHQYALNITAEDDDGDQAAAQIVIDGLGSRLQ